MTLTEHTNRVIAVTKRDMVMSMRAKFCELPAMEFAA